MVKFYNLNKDLVDPATGEVMHGKGSTVGESTLKKYGVTKYQEAGSEVVGPEVKEDAKQSLFNKFKEELQSRNHFKQVKIGDTGDNLGTYMSFKSSGKKFINVKRGNDLETALHESIHSILDDNQHLTAESIADGLEKGTFIRKDIEDLSDLMRSLGYSRNAFHAIRSIDQLVSTPDPNRTVFNAMAQKIEPAVDELVAQASGRKFWERGEGTIEKADRLLRKTVGDEMTDFLRSGYVTQDQYYPKYNSENRGYYQEAGQEEVGKAKPAERASLIPGMTSVYDRVEQKFKDNPNPKVREIATKVTQQLKKFSGEKEYLEGKFGNSIIQASKEYTPQEIQRVQKNLYQMDDKGFSSVALTEREQQLAKETTKLLREPKEMQQALKLLVKQGDSYRLAGMKKDGYFPNVLNPEVAYEWANNFDSAKAKEYDKLWIEHAKSKGIAQDEAQQLLDTARSQMANRSVGGDQTVDYGPIRKAEGIGLPFELSEPNFNAAISMYAKRAAKDLAFYKHLQSIPEIRHALTLKDQFGNIPQAKDMPEVSRIGRDEVVQEALKFVTGSSKPDHPLATAAARLVANGVMGVGTAAKNVVSLPVNIAPYIQADQAHLIPKALANIKDSSQRAFESGAVKANFSDFEGAGIYEGNPNQWIRLVNKASQFLRKYQGRDLSDKFEGEMLYSLGELMLPSTIQKAKEGNKDSLHLLERISDLVDGGHEAILKGKELTPDDQSRMAKRFVDITRGTYGPEGLPAWALEGWMSPFAALSRFGIEKSNTVQKDIVNPIVRDSNFAPLLKTALTALGVGAGIEELNKLLNNRKANEPTIGEVKAVGSAADVAAKTISLLQLASFGGIASDLAKAGLNMSQGKGVKFNNPLSFPLQSFITDTLAGNISDAFESSQKGEDKFQIITKLVGDIATQSIQSLRYLKNNSYGADDMKDADKLRDLRTYEEMSGKGKTTPDVKANSYMGMNEKKFKKTADLQEAAGLLPDLIKKYVTQYGNDPVTLSEKLKGLKEGMSDDSMPNLEKKPDEFGKYVEFLVKTQGPEKARQAIVDYYTHTEANKAKSEMVP